MILLPSLRFAWARALDSVGWSQHGGSGARATFRGGIGARQSDPLRRTRGGVRKDGRGRRRLGLAHRGHCGELVTSACSVKHSAQQKRRDLRTPHACIESELDLHRFGLTMQSQQEQQAIFLYDAISVQGTVIYFTLLPVCWARRSRGAGVDSVSASGRDEANNNFAASRTIACLHCTSEFFPQPLFEIASATDLIPPSPYCCCCAVDR